jgi:hypothetical protein
MSVLIPVTVLVTATATPTIGIQFSQVPGTDAPAQVAVIPFTYIRPTLKTTTSPKDDNTYFCRTQLMAHVPAATMAQGDCGMILILSAAPGLGVNCNALLLALGLHLMIAIFLLRKRV